MEILCIQLQNCAPCIVRQIRVLHAVKQSTQSFRNPCACSCRTIPLAAPNTCSAANHAIQSAKRVWQHTVLDNVEEALRCTGVICWCILYRTAMACGANHKVSSDLLGSAQPRTGCGRANPRCHLRYLVSCRALHCLSIHCTVPLQFHKGTQWKLCKRQLCGGCLAGRSPADDGTAEWATCLKGCKKVHQCRLQTRNNMCKGGSLTPATLKRWSCTHQFHL